MTTNNIHEASRQWASRPDDQRFLSLEELKRAVELRKTESWTATSTLRDLRMVAGDGRLALALYDPSTTSEREIEPTNWSFNQLSQYAKAPAAYLRQLPVELAAINLQYGLEHNGLRENALVLAQSNHENLLRAMTSQTYGRIWDIEVVNSVEKVNVDGRWQIPAASYSATNPRRATTLYASDRNVFIFLVDPNNPVEVNGETLFRGFITWNSEVGAAVFGLTTFLYRYVCDNRIVWGVSDVKELRIRHVGGAPERFAYEGQKYLTEYANESTAKVVETVKAAQKFEIPKAAEKGKVEAWLKDRGFTAAIAKKSVERANEEEGGARSLWNIVNGITAYARSIPHTDERVEVEAAAGKLLEQGPAFLLKQEEKNAIARREEARAIDNAIDIEASEVVDWNE